MKREIISIIVCPKCKTPLIILKERKGSRNRIQSGELRCKKCGAVFKILDDIACFLPVSQGDKSREKIQKMQKLVVNQELEKKWVKYFPREEFLAVRNEWSWMINNLDLKKSKIHLDWGAGTGRFLREFLRFFKGEIIALEIDYPTCVALKTLLKRLKKYSQVTIICGDAKNMPLCSNSIDSISSWHGLDEPNIKKALNESKRILKTNKVFSASGLFFEKGSRSLRIAKESGIEFAKENRVCQHLRKIGFRDIEYKIFFKGRWSDYKSFLPRFGDFYTCYAISGRK